MLVLKLKAQFLPNIVFLATKKTAKKLSLYIQFALRKHLDSNCLLPYPPLYHVLAIKYKKSFYWLVVV